MSPWAMAKTQLEKENKRDNSHAVFESQDSFYGEIHSHPWAHELLSMPEPDSEAQPSQG